MTVSQKPNHLLRWSYPLIGVLIGGFIVLALWLLTHKVVRTPYIAAFAAGFTTIFILSILGLEEKIAKKLVDLGVAAADVTDATGDLIVAKQRNIVVTALMGLAAAISNLPWE